MQSFFCFKSIASPIIVAADTNIVDKIADLSAKNQLKKLKLVNFKKYPELKNTQNKLLAFIESLLIEEDGKRPIILFFVDDLEVNASYIPTTKGPRALTINLGILKFVLNDSELAYIMGHELEHGHSLLNQKYSNRLANAIQTQDVKSYINLNLKNKVAENEVDVMSVFRRVHKKGHSVYAALDVMGRMMKKYGNELSGSHTKMSTRINAIELEISIMSRIFGENLLKESENRIIDNKLSGFLNSKIFEKKRLAVIDEIPLLYNGLIDDLFLEIKKLENATKNTIEVTKQAAKEKMEKLISRYTNNHAALRAELSGVISDKDFLDVHLQHQASFAKKIKNARNLHFPTHNLPLKNIEQFYFLNKLATLGYRSRLSTDNKGSPIGNINNTIAKLKDELKNERLNLGVVTKEDEIKNIKSRIIALNRELEQSSEQKKLIYSGYNDIDKAVGQSKKIESKLYSNVFDFDPGKLFKERMKLEFMQKHIGPLIEDNISYRKKLLLENKEILLKKTFGDDLELALETLGLLDRQERKKRFPEMIASHISIFKNKLSNAKTKLEIKEVLENSFKFYSKDIQELMPSDTNFESMFKENPERLAELLNEYMGLYIKNAVDEVDLAYLSLGIFDSSNSSPISAYVGYGSNRFNVKKKLLKKMNIKNLSLEKYSKNFNLIMDNIIQVEKIENLSYAFSAFDEYYNRISLLVKSDLLPIQIYDESLMKGQILAITQIIKSKLDPKLKLAFEKMPMFLEQVISLRYLEVANIDTLDSAGIKRFAQDIDTINDNNLIKKFINGTIDFDSFIEFVAPEMGRTKAFDSYFKNSELFTNGRKRIIDIDKKRYIQFIQNRQQIYSELSSNNVDGIKLKNAIDQINTSPDLSLFDKNEYRELLGQLEYKSENSIDDIIEKRVLTLMNSNKLNNLNDIEKYERLIKILSIEVNLMEKKNLNTIIHTLKLNNKLSNSISFLTGYSNFLKKEKNLPKDSHALKKHLKNVIGEIAQELLDDLESIKNIKNLNLEGKINYFKLNAEILNSTSVMDILFDKIWEETDSMPKKRLFLLDESYVGNLYYDSTKRKLAVWQIEKSHNIKEIENGYLAKTIKTPSVSAERGLIREIQATLDNQFPTNSFLKDTVLNIIENKIRTTSAEIKVLNSSRLNLKNWTEMPELLLADIPSSISEYLSSNYDRKELLEYLIGVEEKLPKFILKIDVGYNKGNKKLHNQIRDLKARFTSSPIFARTIMLQPLLDNEIGILSEPEIFEDLKKTILGDNYDIPVIKKIFENYIKHIPASQQKVVLANILGSFADSKSGAKVASLKTILEAMGPLGIKAGQFLYTSGLLPTEKLLELSNILDNALPPDRASVVADIKDAFGNEGRGLFSIDDMPGSGSINYVQGAVFVSPESGDKIEAVIKIRRHFVEGVVFNENEYWLSVINDLKSSDDINERVAGDLIEEVRAQSYSTLKVGGHEMDASIERGYFESASIAYNQKIKSGRAKGFSIEANKPITELQSLVNSKNQKNVSVYERVHHTPLKNITDPNLRAAIASEIVKAELSALLDQGQYDPDGHIGNWLIDLDKKKIVRIDYPQMREMSDKNKKAFKLVFKQLTSSNPNFSNKKNAKALAYLLNIQGDDIDLEALIVKTSKEVRWKGNTQEKLFLIRRSMQESLGSKVNTNILLGDELRSGFSSLAKINSFKKYIGKGYYNLFSKYLGLSGLFLKIASMKGKTQSLFQTNLSQVKPKKLILNTKTKKSLEVVKFHDLLVEDKELDLSHEKDKITFTDNKHNRATKGYYKVDIGDWLPDNKNSIYRINREILDELPIGAILYPLQNPNNELVKGLTDFEIDSTFTPDQKLYFGIKAEHFIKYGGPKVKKIVFGPPQNLDLTNNPYYTNSIHQRILLMTPEQFSTLPEGTVLFDSNGEHYLKGTDDINLKLIDGYISVGFPDITQQGFKQFGAEGCFLKLIEDLI